MLKKALLIAMSGLCALSLAACSSSSSNEETSTPKQEEKAKNTDEYPTKTVNNMEMQIKNIETTENGKGDKNIVQITMSFKNKMDSKEGIGGNDFILKSGDKIYKVKTDASNIGTEIAPGKTVSGPINFELPKDVKSGEFSYQPVTFGKEKPKVLATWKITIPNNK
ncbi:DUF4352 domain-containing protein [Listeria booriae]|uniref:DUF4352 domain-containing protein n=1 Tax=Listeria booriae TaxID=1552123 RepID=UPI0016257981|nr:DUF4352 domain-containing protein [Listeria booriae]MBC1558420.1 DUF4352 domain-containing protein [Listeria booriae]MBC1911889.1 DUF4352 domain-containing protein [Listeria booriae]MBC2207855.1 DUF4352 domain-containing protein [Listeria booriae]